jgi:hypothetical protein
MLAERRYSARLRRVLALMRRRIAALTVADQIKSQVRAG